MNIGPSNILSLSLDRSFPPDHWKHLFVPGVVVDNGSCGRTSTTAAEGQAVWTGEHVWIGSEDTGWKDGWIDLQWPGPPIFCTEKKTNLEATRRLLRLIISWTSSRDWLLLGFLFSTENWGSHNNKQTNHPVCTYIYPGCDCGQYLW